MDFMLSICLNNEKKNVLIKRQDVPISQSEIQKQNRTKDYEWNSKCNLKRARLSWSQEDDNTNYNNANYKKKTYKTP